MYAEWNFSKSLAAILFLFASLTDFFDGYLARALHAQSKFGKLFDPIADKMIVATAIIMLVHSGRIAGLSLIPVVLILCREIFISGFREYLAKTGKESPVNNFGKLKTISQMIAILLLLLSPNYYVAIVAKWALWIAAFLSVASGYMYFTKSEIIL